MLSAAAAEGESGGVLAPRRGAAGPLLLAGGAAAGWCLFVRRVGAGDLSDYGLVSALPVGSYVAVAALMASFAWALTRQPLPRWLLAGQVVALVVVLHGVTAIVEPLPRFSTAWFHSGFTEFIARTGRTMPDYDARFSWPGFFALAALLTKVAGFDQPLVFLQWTAVVVNLLALLLVWNIAGSVTDDDRCRFVALWVFVLGNWIGQDYFAPQALGFLLLLTIVAILLRYFRGDGGVAALGALVPPRAKEAARKIVARSPLVTGPRPDARGPLWAPGGEAAPGVATSARVALVGLLVVLAFALVVSHQLTPFLLVLDTAALAAVGFVRLRFYPVVVALLAVAWLSFGAIAFWKGHLHDLFGGLGNVGAAVGASTAQRIGTNVAHQHVIAIRLGLTAATWLLAGAGLVRRLRAGYGPWPMVLLAVVPFAMLGGQSYGGEVLLRSQLFALPFLAVLVGFAFFPSSGRGAGRLGLAATALAAVSAVLGAGFLVARYGNERFEYFTAREKQAVDYLYRVAPPRSSLVALWPTLPWRYKLLDEFDYPTFEPTSVPDVATVRRMLDSAAPRQSFLIFTRSEEAWGELTYGMPAGWGDQLLSALDQSGEFRTLFANRDARVMVLTASAFGGGG